MKKKGKKEKDIGREKADSSRDFYYARKRDTVSATKRLVARGPEENSMTRNDISVTENIHPYKNSVEIIENN